MIKLWNTIIYLSLLENNNYMKNFEHKFEALFFASRWLLAPFFFGLALVNVVLLIKFAKGIYLLILSIFTGSPQEIIINVLTLIDISLLASLLLIIAFSGYENFVSKFNLENHEDRPSWMGKVSFSDLKLKLIGAIVAISAVDLLVAFINVENMETNDLMWKVIIHLTFVISAIGFALTDLIAAKSKAN